MFLEGLARPNQALNPTKPFNNKKRKKNKIEGTL